MNQTLENQTVSEINLGTIQHFAQNLSVPETRSIPECGINQGIRQGDVYAIRIDNFKKADYKISSERQLAPGTTQGSRHTVDESVEVWVPENNQYDVKLTENGFTCLGPVVVAKNRWNLMHPQHAHFDMPEGTYQISYQVDPVQQRRVLD